MRKKAQKAEKAQKKSKNFKNKIASFSLICYNLHNIPRVEFKAGEGRMRKSNVFARTVLFAFKNTYTIGISWVPVALAFGLIVRESGVPFYWAGISGLFCPCGSLQMLIFSFVTSNITWGTVLITSAAVSFRHLFYGLSFLERFRKFGASRQYLIYMLYDELYSVCCSIDIPKELDEKKVHIACAVLLQSYWVTLSTLSAFLGAAIPLDLTGVDFALTALFAVILIEMMQSSSTKIPTACAAVCGVVSLLIFGPDHFLMYALLLTSAALILLRPLIEQPQKECAEHE